MSEIHLQLNEADAVAAHRLYHGIVLRRRRVDVWLPLMIIVISLLYGTGHGTSAGKTIATAAEFAGAATVIMTLAFLVAYFIIVPRRARRGFRQNHMLREEMLLTTDQDALHIVQASATGRRQWATFRSWAENNRTLLLLSTDQLFFLLPKRILTEDDLADIRAHLVGAGVGRARTFASTPLSRR